MRPLSLVNRTFALVAKRDLARELRGPAAAVLALGRRDSRGRGSARVLCRGQVLRRALPRVPVALADCGACCCISRSCWRARITRRRSSCFNLGPKLMQRYRGIFRTTLRGGEAPHGPPRRLGFRARARRAARRSMGLTLGSRSATIGAGHHARADDDVSAAVQAGAVLGSAMLSAIGGMYEDNLYLSNLYEYLEQPLLGGYGQAEQGLDPDRGHRIRQRELHVSRRREAAPSAT